MVSRCVRVDLGGVGGLGRWEMGVVVGIRRGIVGDDDSDGFRSVVAMFVVYRGLRYVRIDMDQIARV